MGPGDHTQVTRLGSECLPAEPLSWPYGDNLLINILFVQKYLKQTYLVISALFQTTVKIQTLALMLIVEVC